LEETVLKTNLEAVKEAVNQLRFRNIGGLIIIDLIDMDSGENRDKVNKALQEAVRGDKAKTNILKISELGLVEMTRKRTRENLVQMVCEPCSYCEGRGYVLSRDSVAFKVLREIRKDLPRFCGRRIAVTVHPKVAEQLLGAGKDALAELSKSLGRDVEVRARPGLHQEQFEVESLSDGPPVEFSVSWLEDPKSRREKGGAKARRGNGAEPAAEPSPADAESPESSPEVAVAAEIEPEPALPAGEADPASPAETANPRGEDAAATPAPNDPPAAAESRGNGADEAAPEVAQAVDEAPESRILPDSEKHEEP
ncbi:MAG: ribonuclease E/G, partial [Proteobacteria bacterium]|nr:ribonuclease E/G [Pseudomonadota bacterium]